MLGKARFYYPGGDFPIHSTIVMLKAGRFDEDWAKKILTDITTKALSKLGFSADVFLGMYDDNKYVNSLKGQEAPKLSEDRFQKALKAYESNPDAVTEALKKENLSEAQMKVLVSKNIFI